MAPEAGQEKPLYFTAWCQTVRGTASRPSVAFRFKPPQKKEKSKKEKKDPIDNA
jgi:hypothetical protein